MDLKTTPENPAKEIEQLFMTEWELVTALSPELGFPKLLDVNLYYADISVEPPLESTQPPAYRMVLEVPDATKDNAWKAEAKLDAVLKLFAPQLDKAYGVEIVNIETVYFKIAYGL